MQASIRGALGNRVKLGAAGSHPLLTTPARPFPLGPAALVLRLSLAGGSWACSLLATGEDQQGVFTLVM